MRQIKIFSDKRHNDECAYCGGVPDTRDHVPSKILLESSFPENIPVVPCCLECNRGFSLDEEYFACLIECIICGTIDIDNLKRDKIKRILSESKKLHEKIKNALFVEDNHPYFIIENERFINVILKLAYGHIKFELSQTKYEKPKSIWYKALNSLNIEEYNHYFELTELGISPEIGSRSTQNIYISENNDIIDLWNTVQENIYTYSVTQTAEYVKVRIIIWNYIVCEIIW